MGKTILIVLLGAIVIYGVTNLVINQNLYEMSEGSIESYAQTKVRNIGNTTVEILKARVSADLDYRVTSPATMSVEDGTVKYRAVDTTYAGEPMVKFDIRSDYLDESKTIIAFLRIRNSVPAYFNRSVLGENEVTFNGNQLSVKDTNQPKLNADIHSNTLVKLNGSNYLFEGFVTSSGAVVNAGTNINVIPNYNPLGSPVIQQFVAPVLIPNFVATTFLPKADVVYNSDHTFSGLTTLGTMGDPKIIYVKGKATFSATNITGYGVIVSEQEVNINGNVTINSPHPLHSQFGIFTSGKFNLNNTGLTVEATMYCQDESVVNTANVKVIGSITSKSKITFNGLNEKLYYKPPSDAITSLFFNFTYLRPVIAYWYE